MHGIGYALGAMVMYGVGDLVYKRAALAGAPANRFMMVQSWLFTACVATYGILTGTLRFDPPALWGIASGCFMFAGFYNFARSLRGGAVSINAPIFRMSFTVTAALAVLLLGESVTPFKLAGLILAPGAVWLLLGGPRRDRPATATGESLLRVVLATIAVGIGQLIYKIGLTSGATPAGLLTTQGFVVVSLATGLTAIVDRRIRPTGTDLRHGAVAALVLSAAFILLLESLARGAASVMVPIAQMGFVVTAAVGILFLREPFTPRVGVGLALALAALAGLALS
jgi:drug/metabolite transporter (DMT)-like permease